ncbi:MAG: hypothetical protein EB078_07675, partial [Proteobacteria bacterium]|nr:hypothetical protein [Pseudomonadota bacterium]
MRLTLFGVMVLLASPSFAQRPGASRPDVNLLRAQSPVAQSTAAFSGSLEARPTLGTRKGTFTTENSYELGASFRENQRLSLGGMIFTSAAASGNQE